MNVICVEEEVLSFATQFIESGDGQCAMNGELAESPALLALEVLKDQGDQSREVGVVGTAEKVPSLGGSEGMPAAEQGEEFILIDILEGAGAPEGVGQEFVP